MPSARSGRYSPDISFSSAAHDGYFGCLAAGGESCVADSGGGYTFEYSYGTTTTLTVTTTASTSATIPPRQLFWPSAGGAALAFVLIFGLPVRRRRWLSVLGAMLLPAISSAVLGCGGSSSSGGGKAGTPAGTYTITITGTSGSITEMGTATLTVQ